MSALWQPTSALASTARQIDAMLETHLARYEKLKLTRQLTSAPDAYALGRMIAGLTVARDDLWLLDEQLRRWSLADLNTEQRDEVTRLSMQMLQLYDVIDATLRLAGELQKAAGTK